MEHQAPSPDRTAEPFGAAPTSPGASSSADRRFFVWNAVVSTAAIGFLGWLLLVRSVTPGGRDLTFLPPIIASLNGLGAVFLALGRIAIARGNRALHQRMMVSAFASSTAFLVCYVAYHAAVGHQRYPGGGPMKVVYLLVLASHVLLSVTVVPGSLAAFWYAYRRSFERHRKVVRWLWPVWMYVSVTGVLVYVLRSAA